MSYAKIRPRRGTLYEWSTVNPVLAEGEMVIEYPDTGVGTGLSKFKIGNGTTPYTQLPYAFDGASATAINGGNVTSFHLIQLRAGTSTEWSTANPILEKNEVGFDTTKYSIKIGDGVSRWNDLGYISAGDTVNPIDDYGDEDAV